MTTHVERTVLIAGGAGGMGLATAHRLGSQGDVIILADLPGPRLDAALSELLEAGIAAKVVPLDIRDCAQCKNAASEAARIHNKIDILINAAGVWLEGPSEDVTEQEWDRVIDINLKGTFFLISAAIPYLKRAKGVVINIASDAGLVGNSGAAVYCASKGGVVLLTKALALELAPFGVRVNAICPADVATPMVEYQAQTFGNGDPDAYKRQLLSRYPQGSSARFIRPDEVARMIEYLCEPDAAPVTGAAMVIDFGLNAGY